MGKKRVVVLTTFVVTGLIALFLLIDFSHFVKTCRYYGELAGRGPSLIREPVVAGEVLVVLTGDRRRIPQALDLLRLRNSPALLISGINPVTTLTALVNSQGDSTSHIQEIWKRIHLESHSTSTIENAEESKKFLQKLHATRVILITSDYHMARSLIIFKLIFPGVEYIPYPIVSEFTDLFHGNWGHAADGISKVIVEYWKFVLFRFYTVYRLAPR